MLCSDAIWTANGNKQYKQQMQRSPATWERNRKTQEGKYGEKMKRLQCHGIHFLQTFQVEWCNAKLEIPSEKLKHLWRLARFHNFLISALSVGLGKLDWIKTSTWIKMEQGMNAEMARFSKPGLWWTTRWSMWLFKVNTGNHCYHARIISGKNMYLSCICIDCIDITPYYKYKQKNQKSNHIISDVCIYRQPAIR